MIAAYDTRLPVVAWIQLAVNNFGEGRAANTIVGVGVNDSHLRGSMLEYM